MNTLHAANLGLRFLLELCMLAALGYWGFHTGDGPVLMIALGLGAPLLAAVIWGLFIAPRAIRPVSELVRLLLEIVLFGAATLALAAAGQPTLAWLLAIAYVVNRVLLYISRPRDQAVPR